MPKLTVIIGEAAQAIPLTAGASVRELIESAGLRIRSGCRGNGACGLCLVQVEAGQVHEPTRNERLLLSPEQLGRNTRLACQMRPEDDLCVRVIGATSPSPWRNLEATALPCTPAQLPSSGGTPATETGFGLAVDLGTTHLSLSLWDLAHGRRRCGRTGANPQFAYGSDVVSRLIAASESAETARDLAGLVRDAVHQALLEICSQCGVSPAQVVRVTLVGNTAMLALLTETDPRLLEQPSGWTRPLDLRPIDRESWRQALGLHEGATVEVIAPLAGFVGSDLLAGVLATDLAKRAGALLIDFGTNSEMALWDGRTLWATSAAGGPAFEGCRVQCGMPAEPGAIYRVERRQNSEELQFQIIGGGEAKGLCGSGLVDLMASLRETGELTATGKFLSPQAEKGYYLRRESPTLRLTHVDVDMFQRAKAAIGVGVRSLLARAGMGAGELTRICVCGSFGRHLSVANAQALGLLPDVPAERIELCGNTALAGCERLLVLPAAAAELASLREQATVVNLAQSPDFEQLFLESLYLQPLEAEKDA
jgi:uncharacterized 2Fe-2S/4Fe-4S cluster protein (DUF4445 family)